MSEHSPAPTASTTTASPHRASVRPTRPARTCTSTPLAGTERFSPDRAPRRLASTGSRIDVAVADHLLDLVLASDPFRQPKNAKHAVWGQIMATMRAMHDHLRFTSPQGLKVHLIMLCKAATTRTHAHHASLPKDLRDKILRYVESKRTTGRGRVAAVQDEGTPSAAAARATEQERDAEQEEEGDVVHRVAASEDSVEVPRRVTAQPVRRVSPRQDEATLAYRERMAERINRENMAFLENQRLLYSLFQAPHQGRLA